MAAPTTSASFEAKRNGRVMRFTDIRDAFRKCGPTIATDALLEIMERTGDQFVNDMLAATMAAGEETQAGPQVWHTSCGKVNLHAVMNGVNNCVRLQTTRTMAQSGIFSTLLPQLKWGEVFVAGGAVTKIVLPPDVVAARAEYWGKGDLDLWAQGAEARARAENVVEQWAKSLGTPYTKNDHSFVTKYKSADWNVDVIELKENGTPEELVRTFDVPCCKAWMVGRSGLLDITLEEDFACNYMTICPVCEIFAPESNRTATRVLKYRQRGFAITPHYRLCQGCCKKAIEKWNTIKHAPGALDVEGRQAVRTFTSGQLDKINELTAKTTPETVFMLREDERQYMQKLMEEYVCVSALWAERGTEPDESDPVYQRLQALKTRRQECVVAAKKGTLFPPEQNPVLETDFDSADVAPAAAVHDIETDDETEEDLPLPKVVAPLATKLRRGPRAAAAAADDDSEDGEDDEDDEDDGDGAAAAAAAADDEDEDE